jgi:four helix bundle protein
MGDREDGTVVVQGFRELRVWQSGMELLVRVYELTRTLPKTEIYGLSSQLQRAAVSVPANIAEGHSRNHLREYLQFLSIARSSLAEVATYLELIERLSYAPSERTQPLLDLTASLNRQLLALRDSLSTRLQEDSLLYDPPPL